MEQDINLDGVNPALWSKHANNSYATAKPRDSFHTPNISVSRLAGGLQIYEDASVRAALGEKQFCVFMVLKKNTVHKLPSSVK